MSGRRPIPKLLYWLAHNGVEKFRATGLHAEQPHCPQPPMSKCAEKCARYPPRSPLFRSPETDHARSRIVAAGLRLGVLIGGESGEAVPTEPELPNLELEAPPRE